MTIHLLLFACSATLLLMLFIWLLFLILKKPAIIDCFWSIAILLNGLIYSAQQTTKIAVVLKGILVLWACRLSFYLFYTRILKAHQDRRYHAVVDPWNMPYQLGFLCNFLLQGLLSMIMAIPMIWIGTASQWHALTVFGAALCLLGIIGESTADWQLASHKKHCPGTVCRRGLWQLSRHPNYFCDWLVWVGFACAAMPATPWGWLAVASPTLLFTLMNAITLPITEQSSLKSKPIEFAQYQKDTPAFFPRGHKRQD